MCVCVIEHSKINGLEGLVLNFSGNKSVIQRPILTTASRSFIALLHFHRRPRLLALLLLSLLALLAHLSLNEVPLVSASGFLIPSSSATFLRLSECCFLHLGPWVALSWSGPSVCGMHRRLRALAARVRGAPERDVCRRLRLGVCHGRQHPQQQLLHVHGAHAAGPRDPGPVQLRLATRSTSSRRRAIGFLFIA